MKYLFRVITLSLLFFSCSPQADTDLIPEDLAGKKKLLKDKRAELIELNKFIAILEGQIDSLNPADPSKSRQYVTVQPVARKDFNRYVEIQGIVEADDLVDVTSEASGRILKLLVKEGQAVRKGQLVAELDLEQLKKQIAEVEKSLELAVTVYERQERLWKQNIGSELQYLEAKNGKERLEKSLETLRFSLSKSEVFAPSSGVVEREILQAGEIAAPGMPIVQLLNTAKLKVTADVPENYLRAIRRGEQVSVRFPALDLEQKARISRIGNTIDASNRTFSVEANISGNKKLLKPNLLAIMMISDYAESDVVVVPLENVQQEVGGKDYIYIKGEGKNGPFAQKVYVQTGETYDNEVIIVEGLKGGEELIMEGNRMVNENELIQIQNAKTEANNG